MSSVVAGQSEARILTPSPSTVICPLWTESTRRMNHIIVMLMMDTITIFQRLIHWFGKNREIEYFVGEFQSKYYFCRRQFLNVADIPGLQVIVRGV